MRPIIGVNVTAYDHVGVNWARRRLLCRAVESPQQYTAAGPAHMCPIIRIIKTSKSSGRLKVNLVHGSFRTARPTPTPTPARPLRPRLQGITPCTFSPLTHHRTFSMVPQIPAALMSDRPAPAGACLMLAPGRASGLRPRHRA